MALTNQEKQQKRTIKNKQYSAFIDKSIAIPFDEKLKSEGKQFSAWLKENMQKYLRK